MLSVGSASLLATMGLALRMCAHFWKNVVFIIWGRFCKTGARPKRKSIFVDPGLLSWRLLGPISVAPGPKRMSCGIPLVFRSLGRLPASNNRPSRSKTSLRIGHLRVGEGENGRRPNAKHDPNRIKSPFNRWRLTGGLVGGALTCREQPLDSSRFKVGG